MSSILFIQCFTLPCHYCQARSNIHKKRDERKEKKKSKCKSQRKKRDRSKISEKRRKKERKRKAQTNDRRSSL